MATETMTFAFVCVFLVCIHAGYFLLVKKIGNISWQTGAIAIGTGVFAWVLLYILLSGEGTPLDIDLPVAQIEIAKKDFFGQAQQHLQEVFEKGQERWGSRSLSRVFLPAIFEEGGKLLALVASFLLLKKLKTPKRIENSGTAAAAICLVAIGFAGSENMQYVLNLYKNVEFSFGIFIDMISRFLLLPLVHMSFSLYAGYALGRAIYIGWELIDKHNVPRLQKIFQRGKNLIPEYHSVQTLMVMGGLTGSIAIHIAYNFFLEQEMISIALALSMANIYLFFSLLRKFQKKEQYQSLAERIELEQKIKSLKDVRKKIFP